MIRTIHRAKFVLAEADHVLQNAAVHVSDPGRISRVEPWNSAPPGLEVEDIDWGYAIILPGLVNAHCHLELTGLHRRITKFDGFGDWLRQLIRLRRDWTEQEYRSAVIRGAGMALATGTTLIGDVSASGWSWQALRDVPLRKVVFEEVVGLGPRSAPEVVAKLRERLVGGADDCLLVRGVSPHAPYSVSPELFRAVSELALEKSLPLATHVAETRAEGEFLMSGTGEFRELLSELGALPEGWRPPAKSAISYLEGLGTLGAAPLLIHCNYLDESSTSRILGSRSSVVYCPRSHDFFGHAEHPVRQLLDAGVNVALGTDSLASNDSLSLLDEMRFLHAKRADLKPEEILRMATLNGAAALGLGGLVGRLRRGFSADMTVLRLPSELGCRNLARQILEGAGECIATIVAGRIVWRKDPP